MKLGGQVIYAGPLGRHSCKLIEYFEVSLTYNAFSYFFPINRKEKIIEKEGWSYFHISLHFPLFKLLRFCYFGLLSDSLDLLNKLTLYNPLQGIPGVPKIKEGYNPATWMLEVSTSSVEAQLKVDFAEIYTKSSLYQ